MLSFLQLVPDLRLIIAPSNLFWLLNEKGDERDLNVCINQAKRLRDEGKWKRVKLNPQSILSSVADRPVDFPTFPNVPPNNSSRPAPAQEYSSTTTSDKYSVRRCNVKPAWIKKI